MFENWTHIRIIHFQPLLNTEIFSYKNNKMTKVSYDYCTNSKLAYIVSGYLICCKKF